MGENLPAFDTLVASVQDVLPDLPADQIVPTASLKELGANSIDRAEIILDAMARLGLRIPMVNFANARNLHDIAVILQGG